MAPHGAQAGTRPSDVELARAARAGDANCLGVLFERHRPRLYAVALAMTGYRPEAEDAVHDTFLTALARFAELRDPAAVGGWLQAILRNTCRMALRRRRREAGPQESEACFRELREESLVESRIESRQLREWVWGALGKLPEPVRVTALLRYFGSYDSYQELAAILGVPVGTVRSRLFEAKLKLADLLMASAGLADREPERRLVERRAFHVEALRSLFRGERDAFLSHYADDLQLVWSSGAVQRGRIHFAAEIDSDIRAGVLLKPQRVLASGGVTVIEGAFINPPEDPDHCPPGIAMVLFGSEQQTRRLHLHLSPRPPAAEI